MIREPYYITVGKLAELGKKNIPDEFIPACHLIYSSPATISYNSPGAIGFGVYSDDKAEKERLIRYLEFYSELVDRHSKK